MDRFVQDAFIAAQNQQADQEFPAVEPEQFLPVFSDPGLAAGHPLRVEVSGEDVVSVGIGAERCFRSVFQGQQRPGVAVEQQLEVDMAVGAVALPVIPFRESDRRIIEDCVGPGDGKPLRIRRLAVRRGIPSPARGVHAGKVSVQSVIQ